MRPVTESSIHSLVLASGKLAHSSASVIDHTSTSASVSSNSWTSASKVAGGGGSNWAPSSTADINAMDSRPVSAGKELLLECVTQDLGQPRANIWLWFKDGQTIESLTLEQQQQQYEQAPAAATNNNDIDNNEEHKPPLPDTRDDLILKQDNPISDRLPDLSDSNSNNINSSEVQVGQNQLKILNTRSATNLPTVTDEQRQQQQQQQQHSLHHQTKARLLASGRYLFIPSIQLAHKGNYSCVALNRLGPGNGIVTSSTSSVQETALQQQQQQSGRSDSYRLRVALAPSFVQPLAPRTYWQEVQTVSEANDVASASTETHPATANNYTGPSKELQQQQQLELTCHVQCEPICHIEWLRNNEFLDLKRQSDNIVSYHVRHTVIAEHVQSNMFKSIESKLVLQFRTLPASALSSGADQTADKRLRIDRDKRLERRHYLNNSNFTCQSSSNIMGPSVRSTTQFVVQCK